MGKNKWNLSKSDGINLTINLIENILINYPEKKIPVSELIYLLNSRTKGKIKNNNKDKTLISFIKYHYPNFKEFIESRSEFKYTNINNNNYITPNNDINENINYEYEDWVIINGYSDSNVKIKIN
jgi:hypothetical protein